MHRVVMRLVVLAVLFGAASTAIAKLTGAPKGVTGAPAVGAKLAEPNCHFCHDPANGLNDPSGSVEILDLPEQFALDTDYVLRVRLSHTWDPASLDPPAWGFSLTAVRADSGTGYGTFTPGAGAQIASTNTPGTDPTRRYVTHTADGLHTGSLGPVEWTMTWRSPSYPAAKVYFFAAGNSANGSMTIGEDWIFTTSDSMNMEVVGVEDHLLTSTELARPTPQPAPGRCEIRFSLGVGGSTDLAIFDTQGRRVRTLLEGDHPPGPGLARWDGRDEGGRPVSAGVYFARLVAPGIPAARVQKVVLAR